MGGRKSNDLKSAEEPLDETREATFGNDHGPVEVDEDAVWVESADDGGDPFAASNGLVVLRRLAQESSKPGKTQSRFLGRQRRRTRQGNKQSSVDDKASTARLNLMVHPVEGTREDAHTANWCPVVGKNILMRADRSCPACDQAV